MLMAGTALAGIVALFTGDKGRTGPVFQVYRVVVVQGETLPVVLGQFPLRVELGLSFGPGFLPGAGVLVACVVEQVHRLAGQEEAMVASLGHAPHHRGRPSRRCAAAPAFSVPAPRWFP